MIEFGGLIPDEVEAVCTPDGHVLRRAANGMFRLSEVVPGYLSANTKKAGLDGERWFEEEFPLTEVEL